MDLSGLGVLRISPDRGDRLLDRGHEIAHASSLKERVQELRYRAPMFSAVNAGRPTYMVCRGYRPSRLAFTA
jgi:hypothetical protein